MAYWKLEELMNDYIEKLNTRFPSYLLKTVVMILLYNSVSK